MKDELIKQCAAAVHFCRDDADAHEIAGAVLSIARPAILEEAAKAIQCGCCDVCGEDPDYEYVCANELAARIRALATTGQEG